jgi:hypothetical protein
MKIKLWLLNSGRDGLMAFGSEQEMRDTVAELALAGRWSTSMFGNNVVEREIEIPEPGQAMILDPEGLQRAVEALHDVGHDYNSAELIITSVLRAYFGNGHES